MQIEAGKALVNAGLVSAGAIKSATLKSRTNNKPLLVNLFEGIDTDTQKSVTDTLAKFYNIPLLHLNRINPSPNLMRACKLEQARQWYFLPIAEQGPHVVVGMIDPTDLNNVDMLQHIFHKPVQPVFIYAHDFENGLYRFFRKSDERPVENTELLNTVQLQHALIQQKPATAGGDNESQATIAARFARHIISRALTYGASSLIIEPKESELMISLNIEGGIYQLFRLSLSHHERMMTALKQMVGLDTANGGSQRRSVLLRFSGREYKLLIHFHPSPSGERATIRIIDPQLAGMSLEQLDLPSDIESTIKTSLAGSGLILVTGPSGSGKSSTTMALLRHLVENGKHRIISMEDLVIGKIPGVKQVQIPAHGPAKPDILKSVLAHKPDVVVIDEATDEEAMVMAVQAASSGRCLLILCMEADGTAEAISRLLRMRLDRSQLADSLRFAYMQKIIRKICPDCRRSVSIHPDTRRQLHIPSTFTFYAGSGCDACKNTGYRGTATIGELLPFSSDLSEMLENGASGSEIYTEARHQGMYTLYERALNKAIDGATSLEEALGVFSLPHGFDFKHSLHLGRVGHLQKPESFQSNTQERLASKFEEGARKQAEPPEIDIFAADGEEQAPASETRRDNPLPETSDQDHVPAVSEQESPVPECEEASVPDKLSVLLLDDSPVMLEYTRHILSGAGIFSVETASTAEEAWDKLQHQYFHLVITDHEMPGQTGQQLIERIRQQPTLNHTGTMLLTGNVKEASALSDGADGYVGKPTDPELLVARARSIAEIYKRMSMGADARPRPAIVEESRPQSKGEAAGHVDFTDQDMNRIGSFELDTQRFKLPPVNTPESDLN